MIAYLGKRRELQDALPWPKPGADSRLSVPHEWIRIRPEGQGSRKKDKASTRSQKTESTLACA
jgi:hypothetical protein